MAPKQKRKRKGNASSRRKKPKVRDLQQLVEAYLDGSEIHRDFVTNIKQYIARHTRKLTSGDSGNDKIVFELKINGHRYQGIKVSNHLKAPFRQSMSYWYEQNCMATTNVLCQLPRTPEVEDARSRFVIGLEVGGVSEDIIARFSASQLIGRLIDTWVQLVDLDSISVTLDFSTVPRGMSSFYRTVTNVFGAGSNAICV